MIIIMILIIIIIIIIIITKIIIIYTAQVTWIYEHLPLEWLKTKKYNTIKWTKKV